MSGIKGARCIEPLERRIVEFDCCRGQVLAELLGARCADNRNYVARHHPCERKLPRRSEEHTSELQSLMRISYAVFCLKKKINKKTVETQLKIRTIQQQSRHSQQTVTN